MPCNLTFAIKHNNQLLNPVEAMELLGVDLSQFYSINGDVLVSDRANLVELSFEKMKMRIDLISRFKALSDQFKKSSLYKDPLAKAIGCKANYRPDVLDSTFGWGEDSLRMLIWGCKVYAIERNPIIYAVMSLALKKLKNNKIDLFWMDSSEYKKQHEVVYYDPMFEEGDLKALPKKEVQWLRVLAGHGDQNASENAECLSNLAIKRMVVKRSLKANSLIKFDTQIKGKRSRFDIDLK